MPETTTDMIHEVENQLSAQIDEPSEMTVDGLVAQVALVQNAMSAVMTEGEHFGTIPGTEKPTLFKSGAEKLCLLFRLDPQYEVTRRDSDGGHVEYEIVCTMYHIPTGNRVGSGVGLCSTMESRYRWRKGAHTCPQCGTAAIIKGKAEFGGGWLCWRKKDGCGAKFSDDEFSSADLAPIENPDIADSYNTVLKIGKKRAMVDAVLTCTAASDCFTQDLEDLSATVQGARPVPSTNTRSRSYGRPKTGLPGGVPDEMPDDMSTDVDMLADTERMVEMASNPPSLTVAEYWAAVEEAGLTRREGMQKLTDNGGDFGAAIAALEGGAE